MLFLGGRTIGQLCELVKVAEECEHASFKFISPALQPHRGPIVAILRKLEQAIGKHGSTTYLKPISAANETAEKWRAESDESFLVKMVDKEKTSLEAGIKAESIYGRYVKMKQDASGVS